MRPASSEMFLNTAPLVGAENHGDLEMHQCVVNGRGTKPAGPRAKEAIDESTDLLEEAYPDTEEQLKGGSYADGRCGVNGCC